PKRSGHTAAARIEIDDGGRWNARQQRSGRRLKSHRLLMAVAVQEHCRRSVAQAKRDAACLPLALDKVLEERARIGDELRSLSRGKPSRECLTRPRRQPPPAVDLKELFANPPARRAAGREVRRRCETAAPFREGVNMAHGARAPRYAVPLPISCKELALEPGD